MPILYAVIGAGGFGREVMPIVREQVALTHMAEEQAEAVFVVEDDYISSTPKVVNGHRVLSLSEFKRWDGDRTFCIAIQKSHERQRIAESLRGLTPLQVAANLSSTYDGNVIGEGAILCNFTQITSNARIGKHFHLNLYSCVEHDCVIGDYVTFSPGVRCSGRVVIEDHVFIGAGAVIRDGSDKPLKIGEGAVIGMGSVVTKSVEPYTTVAGVPAKPLQR